MNGALWTLDSWGDTPLPENVMEVMEAANYLIKFYGKYHSEDEVYVFSEWLWDYYCSCNAIPNL